MKRKSLHDMYAWRLIGLVTFVGMASLFIQAITRKDPVDPTAAALGKALFFDPILSSERTISCASCHKEQFAFADTSAVSMGVFGRIRTECNQSG